MNNLTRYSIVALIVLLLAGIPGIVGAAPVPPDSSITYTITVGEDGTGVWHVEYRTLLASDEDMGVFDSYANNISALYLPEFQDLMQRSAAQAAAATSRKMEITDFSGDAVIQTSPTGRYGIVFYSFSWKGFAKTGDELTIGDAFAGGLYLAKDHTLIIRYPSGYTVSLAEPAPDQVRDGLIWYGQRSFGAGEPRLVFERSGFPWLSVLLGSALVLIVIAGLFLVITKRRRNEPNEPDEPDEPGDAVVSLSEADMVSLEERIVQMLKATGGEQYQSEIVKNLGLPKSTVSATLNDLHQRGVIQKVKKGRENLIRLT
ncbi:MAG TPA: helix-turn-helix domain-containing protein [Methanoregula sp.]|nr:helix-turn-helix domain-containing protein [Methanoregula sp.]